MFYSIKVGVIVKVTAGNLKGERGRVVARNTMGNVWPWIVEVSGRRLAFAAGELRVVH